MTRPLHHKQRVTVEKGGAAWKVSSTWAGIFAYFVHCCVSSTQNGGWHITGAQNMFEEGGWERTRAGRMGRRASTSI